jgi:2-polyprenyl-6-methoxyphenol hydroxylase-like FAD-dependent oxidoreductase
VRALGTALVIGAGIAGLAAARVLSEHCTRVVVLDRDDLEAGPAPRRCVPQGQHVHLLLASGFRSLCRLFPGFAAELTASGVASFDVGRALRYWRRGRLKQPFESDLQTVAVSRPLLESIVRRRVSQLPNVELHGHCTVTDLRCIQDRVVGVDVEQHAGFAADFVLDAAGRGSHARRWLEEHHFPTPGSTSLDLGLAYASRFVRLAADAGRPWQMLYVGPSAGHWTRGGAILRVENDRALVTLAGYLGDHPPLDDAGFSAFAAAIGPEFAGPLLRAEFASEARRFNVPQMVHHHFERLSRHPLGFLVLGDAICQLDPCFGQGMTVALQEAQLLALKLRGSEPLARLPGTFYRATRALIEAAWTPSACENFRRPGMSGDRPPGLRGLQWYSGHALDLADRDPDTHRALQEGLHMTAGPLRLLQPGMLAKVLAQALRPAVGAARALPAS